MKKTIKSLLKIEAGDIGIMMAHSILDLLDIENTEKK